MEAGHDAEPVLPPAVSALANPHPADTSTKRQQRRWHDVIDSAHGADSGSIFARCQNAHGWLVLNMGFVIFLLVLALVQGGVLLWAMRFPVRV